MSGDSDDRKDATGEDFVPILKPDSQLSERLNKLSAHFTSKFNAKPDFYVKVPGRVNLIGEHIDYCGYAVCPMAIKQDILLAVKPSVDAVHLTNLDPKYQDFKCHLDDVGNCIKNFVGSPSWYKYFLCGVKGALEMIPLEYNPMGAMVAVWGNIPPDSGLSSSSALVSAALLSIVHASQYELRKEKLATVSATAERLIGSQGGGMDQAIAFLGKAGSAKLIEFNPLRATDITLPENAVFVIAHSLAYHNKASTADFNLRVAECRLASQIIAKKRNKDWENIKRLIELQERLQMDLDDMIAVVKKDLHQQPYTVDEICQCLGISLEHLRKISLPGLQVDSQTFKLRQRSLHVFQEASRVEAFCHVNRDTIDENEKLQRLGNLMSKSHASLNKLYECSHPLVNQLVDKAMNCGALGARLTGAGWGGCVVAITTKDKALEFIQDLKKELNQSHSEEYLQLDQLVFQTEPCQGAAIYTV